VSDGLPIRRGPALAVAAAAAVAAVGVGLVSVERAREQLAVMDACEIARGADPEAALAATAGRVGSDATGLAAAECRCVALLRAGRESECGELLARLLADPETEAWAPGPELSVHWIQTWRDAGRSERAAELAHRAAGMHPEDPDLFYLELVTRTSVGDETAVLRELEARAAERDGVAGVRMRVSLANRHLLRGDAESALRVLGPEPPPGPPTSRAQRLWTETRGYALARSGDGDALRALYRAWRERGGDPDELLARYALTLSIAGLPDPEREPVPLLREAVERAEAVDDPKLREALRVRLVLTLSAAGRSEEALAVFERAREEGFELAGLSRGELLRAGRADAASAGEAGRLVFRVPEALPGAELWLSPGPGAPSDAAYERLAVDASGLARATRLPGVHPQRWVLRDGPRALASGTVSVRAGALRRVDVSVRAPRAPREADLARRPADGSRRVLLLLPDCGDWRIVQYLRARGELPVLDALLARGHRAVLWSDPPLTAAALEALVRPASGGESGGPGFLGLVHQLGVELAGLASVGENPFGALAWLLPARDDLFDAVGAGPRTAANLLLAHGGIRAGRHGELTGPFGRERRVPVGRAARDLTASERRQWPELTGLPERDALHVRTIAAEMDAAEELARDRSLDFAALRIEPLDILTHAHYAAAARDGQDDGRGVLFAVYRYLDARLGAVHDLLDADDVLLVMSDHGIRTAMEHSKDALFVADGAGVPAGRAPGTPALRGVSRVVADLLGVPTQWPDTGVAPWARSALAKAEAAADPRAPR